MITHGFNDTERPSVTVIRGIGPPIGKEVKKVSILRIWGLFGGMTQLKGLQQVVFKKAEEIFLIIEAIASVLNDPVDPIVFWAGVQHSIYFLNGQQRIYVLCVSRERGQAIKEG